MPPRLACPQLLGEGEAVAAAVVVGAPGKATRPGAGRWPARGAARSACGAARSACGAAGSACGAAVVYWVVGLSFLLSDPRCAHHWVLWTRRSGPADQLRLLLRAVGPWLVCHACAELLEHRRGAFAFMQEQEHGGRFSRSQYVHDHSTRAQMLFGPSAWT
jgi:hypothetical protein